MNKAPVHFSVSILAKLLASLGVAVLAQAPTLSLASEPGQAARKSPLPPPGNLRLFVSGHSLTDNPIADDILQIAASQGTPGRYNQQILLGSTIRARTHGQGNWSGYRQGKNREGTNTDVIAELREGKAIGGDRYSVLLITERHDLVGAMIWEDTIRHLRHFHEQAYKANPSVQTHLYASWLGIKNKADPQPWIRYERAADQAWQCVAQRVNTSLAHEGRPDRLRHIPAGAALAELVEQATRKQVPGLTQASVQATVNQLFTDDVHLTRAGAYYVALVSYATIYGRSPIGAWAPAGIGGAQARALQTVAWDFVSQASQVDSKNPALAQCSSYMVESFCETFWTYVDRADAIGSCKRTFAQPRPENPLHFDPQRDAGHWLPTP